MKTTRVLGLRAEPDAFNWAVTEGTFEAPVVIAVDRAEGPRTYSDPEILSYLRERLVHVIQTYQPQAIGIRTPEPVARGSNESAKRRLRVEGVLFSVGGEQSLKVTFGAIVTINKLLGSKSAKAILESDEYRSIDWTKYSPSKREAILISASLLTRGS